MYAAARGTPRVCCFWLKPFGSRWPERWSCRCATLPPEPRCELSRLWQPLPMVPTQLQALVVALLADVLAQVCGSQPWASSNDSVDLCAHGQELCGIRSHSGLVPVPRGGSLFYWYFVPPSRNSSAPLVLFLQGGPGAPSMFSVLWEMGPVTLDGRASLLRRPSAETWASEFPLLFVDSPVGTGWSSASGPAGLATSQAEVAGDLVAFLDAFAALHPEAPT
ncbi:unnamed protein product, partial [Prorocentrum cordatum]